MKELLKFEYFFPILIVIILTVALFVFKDNAEIADKILVSLIAALTSITTFLFTKTNPNKE